MNIFNIGVISIFFVFRVCLASDAKQETDKIHSQIQRAVEFNVPRKMVTVLGSGPMMNKANNVEFTAAIVGKYNLSYHLFVGLPESVENNVLHGNGFNQSMLERLGVGRSLVCMEDIKNIHYGETNRVVTGGFEFNACDSYIGKCEFVSTGMDGNIVQLSIVGSNGVKYVLFDTDEKALNVPPILDEYVINSLYDWCAKFDEMRAQIPNYEENVVSKYNPIIGPGPRASGAAGDGAARGGPPVEGRSAEGRLGTEQK